MFDEGKVPIILRHEPCNIWGSPRIGGGTKIGAFVEIGSKDSFTTTIGENCKIEAFAFIPPGIRIGSNVFIGPHACFTNDKRPTVSGKDWKLEYTVVEDGASIGAGAIILPGIRIGAGAIIGAGAVVTKSVEEGATVVGNPARKL